MIRDEVDEEDDDGTGRRRECDRIARGAAEDK